MSTFMRTGFTLLVLVLARAAGAESVAFAQEPEGEKKDKGDAIAPKAPSLADYDVLLRRNIFSHEQPRARGDYRHGHKYSSADGEGFVGPPAPFVGPPAPDAASLNSAESDIVLIGAVQRDGVGTAWLEDRRAGKILMLKSGDSLARGKVGKITVDGIDYIIGEKTQPVALGGNLEGGSSTAKPVEPSTTATGTAGGSGASDPATNAMLEQLKRKRQKEQGQ